MTEHLRSSRAPFFASSLARRTLLGGIGAAAIAVGMRQAGAALNSATPGTGGLPDANHWPAWAPTADATRRRLAGLRSQAVNLRKFGAKLDGSSDDSPAFARALAAGVRAVVLDGPANLSQPVVINRPFAVFGSGKGPHLVWGGNPRDAAFAFQPQGTDPSTFVRDLALSGLHIVRATGQDPGGMLVRATNVRGLVVADCKAERTSLAFITHLRMANYDRSKGTDTVDPAVLAGFSGDNVNDLNEDIAILGNTVDYGVYLGDLARFNFARRVVVQGNHGRFAKISWWGGGAKRQEGGMPEFLRRVRDVYIADNEICNVNGGIYGNNGQSIAVVRNKVWDTNDVGIDFEGCIDCIATLNHCRNAGNFLFSAFYVARNVRFIGNYGEQDGSAATIDARLGSKPYGTPRGIYMAALRGGGFVKMPQAVDVTIADNQFVFSGQAGLGRCLPGYFNRLTFTGNTMRNVVCDLRDRGGENLTITGNRLSFDHAARNPVTLLAGSAANSRIADNTVQIDAPQPDGSVSIGYEAPVDTSAVMVANNTVQGRMPLPIVLASAKPGANLSASSNHGAKVATGLVASRMASMAMASAIAPPVPVFSE